MSAEDVAIRVETGPGEIAQVDFGYIGTLYDPDAGRIRKAWIFVMVLAFSRLVFVCIVFDQKIETWLRCHVEAFAALHGVGGLIGTHLGNLQGTIDAGGGVWLELGPGWLRIGQTKGVGAGRDLP